MFDWGNAFLLQERKAKVDILNLLEDYGARLSGVMLCVKYIPQSWRLPEPKQELIILDC